MSVLPPEGGSHCPWCGRFKELSPFGGANSTYVCGNVDCPDCHPAILFREAKALAEKTKHEIGEAMVMLNNAMTEEHNRINELKGDVEVLQVRHTKAASGG